MHLAVPTLGAACMKADSCDSPRTKSRASEVPDSPNPHARWMSGSATHAATRMQKCRQPRVAGLRGGARLEA